MSLLTIEQLSHGFGDKTVLSQASFRLLKGEHAGLVGVNGSGKSTFLNILSGQLLYDDGILAWAPGIRKGYLKQYESADPDMTIAGVLRGAFDGLYRIEMEIASISASLAVCDHHETQPLLRKLGHLQDTLDGSDFYRIESLVEDCAQGLGLKTLGMETPIRCMSGGQKTKLMLARLLLERPEVLLLDEPTNYLDQEHIAWLSAYLSGYRGSFILVSHDIAFLNSVTNVIWHLEFGRLTRYPGNYEKYVKLSAERQHLYLQNYDRQQKEIRRLEDFISKNITRAATSKRAQSRQKVLEKMEKLEKPQYSRKPSFRFHVTREPEKVVLETLELEIGYDRVLLPKLDMRLERGQKLVLTGFNGIGKTTLLKSLLGLIPLKGGIVSLGRFVSPVYFEQEEQLTGDQTALEYVWRHFPRMSHQEIRKTLSLCGLDREHLEKPMTALSGGERSKARLCRTMLTPGNFLILDEPTNHLDRAAKDVLSETLAAYSGSILLVCHEKKFYERWADGIWDLEKSTFLQQEPHYSTKQ